MNRFRIHKGFILAPEEKVQWELNLVVAVFIELTRDTRVISKENVHSEYDERVMPNESEPYPTGTRQDPCPLPSECT